MTETERNLLYGVVSLILPENILDQFDMDDKSVILSEFPIKADGTSISPEFADFLKRRAL